MMMATMSIIRSSISFVQMTKNCGGGSALFGPLCTGQQCSSGAAAVAARGGTGWCGGSSLTPAPQVIPNDNIPMDLICPSHTWDKTSNFFPLTSFFLTDSFIILVVCKGKGQSTFCCMYFKRNDIS